MKRLWNRWTSILAVSAAFLALPAMLPDHVDAQRGARGGARTSVHRSGGGGGARASAARTGGGYAGGARGGGTAARGGGTAVRGGDVNVGDVNVSRDVHVDAHGHGGYGHGYGYGGYHGYHYHPVARGVAATAAIATTAAVTAAVVGSVVNTLPPSCTTIVVEGVTYQQCGSDYYQPQYSGSQVQYVVVDAPEE